MPARLLSVSAPKSSGHVALSAARAGALGARLRAARNTAELTQEVLAQASGIGTEHIQRIERGAANPTLATLYALADALKVQAETLLPD